MELSRKHSVMGYTKTGDRKNNSLLRSYIKSSFINNNNLYQMSIQFIKQLFALFLLALTILFTVVAINEGEKLYLIGTVIAAIVSYLLIKKKI